MGSTGQPEQRQRIALHPLESRRLMAITSSLVEVPISPAALAADAVLAGYRTFDLRVRIDAGDTWSYAQMHLTLRRGQLYLPDPADHLPEPGEWPSRPNVAYASVLADPDWFAPPENRGNFFSRTRVDATWFAIDPHDTSAQARTVTLARLTLSSDASGVILAQVGGWQNHRTLVSPTVMSDVYKGRAYRTNNGYISGTLFDDRNGDGHRDASETVLPGRTVYLDANNDSRLDANERRTTTDFNGSYEFYGLPTGKYKVREVVVAGFRQTTPHHDFGWSVPLWAGRIEQQKDFGSSDSPAANVQGPSLFMNMNDDRQRDAGVLDGASTSV